MKANAFSCGKLCTHKFFMLGRNLVFIDHVIPKIRELKVVALLVLKTFWFDELLPGYDISDIV